MTERTDDSTLRLEGPRAAVAVSPARGGKITSLVGPSGREWLAQPAARTGPAPETLDFVQGEMAGWDECAPSIDACTVNGASIPDHGDLWSTVWTVTQATGSRLAMLGHGRSFDYVIAREISVTATGLRIDYSASTTGNAVPFLWAAHPQFACSPRSRVRLPAGVDRVVDVLADPDRTIEWSPPLATLESLGNGECRKLYVDPLTSVAHASLVHEDGAELTLTWRGCDYLGLWFDRSAYASGSVIALEPTTGYYDSLARAAASGRVVTLEPGVPHHWSLDLTVTA